MNFTPTHFHTFIFHSNKSALCLVLIWGEVLTVNCGFWYVHYSDQFLWSKNIFYLMVPQNWWGEAKKGRVHFFRCVQGLLQKITLSLDETSYKALPKAGRAKLEWKSNKCFAELFTHNRLWNITYHIYSHMSILLVQGTCNWGKPESTSDFFSSTIKMASRRWTSAQLKLLPTRKSCPWSFKT